MNTWPDDLDLQSWRQAHRDLQGRGSPACPPDDHLIALVLHEGWHLDREVLADHIVRCRRCTDLYQLLLRVQRDLREILPELAPSKPATTGEAIVPKGSGWCSNYVVFWKQVW
jgi:hypothetical protein